MAGINMKGVIGGGLLAGLVINISETILNVPVMGAQMEASLAERNLPAVGGGAIGVFVLGSFIIGIVLVWLYAAIRPRLGPGPKTAVTAGVLVWFLAYLWPQVGLTAMGFMPANLVVFSVVWGLVEVILAALVGGRIYKEA